MASIVYAEDAATGSPLPRDTFGATPTALLADAHRAVRALGAPLRSLGGARRFVGDALTVRAGSLAQWKALDAARPGQVLVIACRARRDRAEFGAIFVEIAARKAIAAIVTDGLLRDREEIAALGIAVFACGSHPSSPADDAEGAIGLPVDLLGASIAQGDILVGDADGVAVIPRGEVAGVMERLARQRERERGLAIAATDARGPCLPQRIRDALDAVPVRPAPAAGPR